MKRSHQVPARLILAISAGIAVTGCGSNKDCVDSAGRIIPDNDCRTGVRGAHYINRVRSGGFGGSGTGGFFGG